MLKHLAKKHWANIAVAIAMSLFFTWLSAVFTPYSSTTMPVFPMTQFTVADFVTTALSMLPVFLVVIFCIGAHVRSSWEMQSITRLPWYVRVAESGLPMLTAFFALMGSIIFASKATPALAQAYWWCVAALAAVAALTIVREVARYRIRPAGAIVVNGVVRGPDEPPFWFQPWKGDTVEALPEYIEETAHVLIDDLAASMTVRCQTISEHGLRFSESKEKLTLGVQAAEGLAKLLREGVSGSSVNAMRHELERHGVTVRQLIIIT